jgi:hypothetical protein
VQRALARHAAAVAAAASAAEPSASRLAALAASAPSADSAASAVTHRPPIAGRLNLHDINAVRVCARLRLRSAAPRARCAGDGSFQRVRARRRSLPAAGAARRAQEHRRCRLQAAREVSLAQE